MIFTVKKKPLNRTAKLLLTLLFARAFAPKSARCLQIQGVFYRAWKEHFPHKITETYPGYDHDKDAFFHMVGNLDKYGRDTIKFAGDDTKALDSGHLVGTIHGRNFQKA